MASLAFPTLSHKYTTPDGTTYGYAYVPAQPSKPTFLLLHGYPATSHEWRHQLTHLPKLGYGVLAPDCLGYGSSDKPPSPSAYSLKRLSGHMDALLSSLKLDKVIGVGHDWGAGYLSRLAFYHPARFSRLVFVNVGYLPPGEAFDVDAINAQTQKQLGYPVFGYWYFFNAWDAAAVIRGNLRRHFALAYPARPGLWAEHLAPVGAARAFLEGEGEGEGGLAEWVGEGEREMWVRIFEQDQDHAGPLNWYKAMLRGVQAEEEEGLGDGEDRKLRVPVLLVVGVEDAVCLADLQIEGTRKWAAGGFRSEKLKCGHWPMLEMRDEFEKLLEDWAEEE